MLSTRAKKTILAILVIVAAFFLVALFFNREEVALILCQRRSLVAYEGLQKRKVAQKEFFARKGRFAKTMLELGEKEEEKPYRYSVENLSEEGFLLVARSEFDVQTMDETGIVDHLKDGCRIGKNTNR